MSPTASLRIDPAHEAVLYLNDVSKDRKYQQFGPSLREMTRMNMWGQMSFCRRNVLTMVFVVDPTTAVGQAVLGSTQSGEAGHLRATRHADPAQDRRL